MGNGFGAAAVDTGIDVGVNVGAHAGLIVMATERVEGFLLASMTGCDVITVAVENVAEKLAQGGHASALESMNANEELGGLKAEGVVGIAEVDMDFLVGLRFGDCVGGMEIGALCVSSFPGLEA